MEETSATISALGQQERDLQAAIRSASDERARKALLLARAPSDTQLQDELSELERELDSYQRDLQRIAEARRALAQAEEADTQQAKAQRLKAAKAEVLAGAADRIAAAAKIERAFKDLEAALIAEAKASDRSCTAAGIAGQLIHPANAFDAVGLYTYVQSASTGIAPALSLLNHVLRVAAERGHKLGQAVQIYSLSDPQPSPTAEAKAAAERLAQIVALWSLEPATLAGSGDGHE